MSSSATGGDSLGCVGDEASPSVSPSMEGVLPIRGVDGSTGEAIPIDAAPSLREADDPFRADVVRWTALDVPSIVVEEDLTMLREAYRIPADIELMLLGSNERACFPRRGCTALHLNVFVSGMRLPLHPMFRKILRSYGLAPTQILSLAASYQRTSLTSCDPSTRQVSLTRSYRLILNRHHCLVELGLMASKGIIMSSACFLLAFVTTNMCSDTAKMDQGRRPRPTLARLTKQRPKVLVLDSVEDTSQKKVIEDLSREGNRAEVAAPDVVEIDDLGVPEGEAPLKRKKKGGASGSGPSQSKKKAVELVDNYTVCAP
ncbi:hypothetical protein Adt_14779 [Abeliophyllum distichum]|uniref:Uncharacterized protein n=1 Tax=Abeliophyllum distichum TaxID=126358 RepID=A0ABD1U0K5_9LAMI